MKGISAFVLLIALLMSLGATALAQDTVELGFMRYQDGSECEVYDDLLSRFSEAGPGIAGTYLDLRSIMEDPSLLDDNFRSAILESRRAEGDMSGLPGFADQRSVTGPYVNATLYEMASLDLPSDIMDGQICESRLTALDEVASATGARDYFINVEKVMYFSGSRRLSVSIETCRGNSVSRPPVHRQLAQ